MERDILEEVTEYLQESVTGAELVDLLRQASQCDGSFEQFEVYDFEDAAEYAPNAYEFGRSIVYGDVTNVSMPVRYNAYGNLFNVTEYELESEAGEMIPELADWLVTSGWAESIDLPDELADILNARE